MSTSGVGEILCAIWAFAIVAKFVGSLIGGDDAKEQQGASHATICEVLGGAVGRTVIIGMYAARVSGNTGEAEKSTVMSWLAERIDELKDEYQPGVRREADKVINAVGNQINEQVMSAAARAIPSEVGRLRQDAMQLAFKVVAADGTLTPAEYNALQSIQRALEITESRFRDLYDIHLANLRREGTSSTTATVDELGMNPAWSKDQKLAHLTKEFAKYSNRMQSARDQVQRDYCKRMLDLITRAREQLMGTARPVNQDEVLLGIESSLGIEDKRALLDKEEERWLARQRITQKPAALQTCRDALAAISRLRLLYADA